MLSNLTKLLSAIFLCGIIVRLHAEEPQLPARADLEQKLDASIPLDLPFRDEVGVVHPLSIYFNQRPVILQLGYYRCWFMCDVVTGGLIRCLQDLHLTPGIDFDIVFVSIDPKESWQAAAKKKMEYVRRYGRASTALGWHFLTGDELQIKALAQAVGFHYFYDSAENQFAHPSGLIIATPRGRVAKYFYGIEFAPRDLRLALVEASHERIGSPVERLLLLCYHWNPLIGKYGLLISRVLAAACILTVVVMGGAIAKWIRRDWRQRRLPMGSS